jgi:ATP-dependent Zn protease
VGNEREAWPCDVSTRGAAPFSGQRDAQPKDFIEKTAQLIDEEIRSIIRAMEKNAEETFQLIAKNWTHWLMSFTNGKRFPKTKSK